MTVDMMNRRDFVEKTPDADLLREMIGFAAKRLVELETGAVTSAGFGTKCSARRVQRNGYRDRDWETQALTVELRIQKLRKFPGTATHGREGADGGDPGSLRSSIAPCGATNFISTG